MFHVQVDTGGAAFRDPYTGEESLEHEGIEVKRLMAGIAEQIDAGKHGGILLDINGNRVGSWSM